MLVPAPSIQFIQSNAFNFVSNSQRREIITRQLNLHSFTFLNIFLGSKMSAATAAAQTVETQNLLLERKRHFSFQSDRLEVRKM